MIRKFGSKAVEKFKHLKDIWYLRHGGDYSDIAADVLDPLKQTLFEKHGGEQYLQVYNNLHNSLKRTLRYTGSSYHNDLKLFHKGEDFFIEMWDRIDNAKERVWLETYIFVNDYVGNTTLEKLTDAAQRGVEVIFLMDGFGSILANTFQKPKFLPIAKAGGCVCSFSHPLGQLYKRILFGRRFISPEVRNHRKLLITDNTAYIGGMNIENKYGDFHCEEDFQTKITSLSPEELRDNFRDTQLRIEGVGGSIPFLESCFVESFEDSTPLFDDHKKPEILEKITQKINFDDQVFTNNEEKQQQQQQIQVVEEINIPKMDNDDLFILEEILHTDPNKLLQDYENENLSSEQQQQEEEEEENNNNVHRNVFIQIMKSHPHQGRKDLQKAVYAMIDAATEYMYITTPYFIPNKTLKRKIKNAARRGVKIKILTSGRSDVLGYYTTASEVYDDFLSPSITESIFFDQNSNQNKVEIFEYNEKLMHSKVFTMDGVFSSVGSYNFDRSSFKTHMEIGSLVYDSSFSEEIEKQFEIDCSNAVKINYEEWNRNRSFFQKILAKILYFLFTKLFK